MYEIDIIQKKVRSMLNEEELKSYLHYNDYFVSRQSLRNIMKVDANPTLRTLEQLAGCLDIHITDLFKE